MQFRSRTDNTVVVFSQTRCLRSSQDIQNITKDILFSSSKFRNERPLPQVLRRVQVYGIKLKNPPRSCTQNRKTRFYIRVFISCAYNTYSVFNSFRGMVLPTRLIRVYHNKVHFSPCLLRLVSRKKLLARNWIMISPYTDTLGRFGSWITVLLYILCSCQGVK